MLFVNIDGSAGYENEFFDDAQAFTWFAQSRQHRETPVIEHIVEGTKPVALMVKRTDNVYQVSFFVVCIFV